MKKFFFVLIPFLFLLLTAFTLAETSEWKLTDGYSIRFKGKGINGFFHSLKGQIVFNENTLSASRVNLEVELNSIRTGNSLKSWHAKRAKWFDAKQYPVIRFSSSEIQKAAKGFVAKGKLNMKGVEREISVPFTFLHNTFFGTFFVRRTDYNVGRMKGFSKMVSDSIQIDFTIPVTP